MSLPLIAPPSRLRCRVFVIGAITGVLLMMAALSPAMAAPATKDDTGSAARTIDPSAPTPTAPPASGPAQGFGPGGVTIGGPTLDTRGQVLYDGAPALPAGLNTHGLVLADLGTGQILAAQDPHGLYYPASTLKTLTFLALYPQLDPNQVLTATRADATVEGSRVGIVENGTYTVAQLWTALMLQSGNDAASMLTAAAGGPDAALKLMREKAESLQAFDTLPGTTSGLDVAGQSSSPYDLAIFMREIVANPALLAIIQQPLGELPAQPPKYPAPMQYGNQNDLLRSYPGALGGKTGFTDAARHTFVAAASRNGRTLVVSLMDAENQPTLVWQQAAALLDWGFAAPASASGAGRLVTPDEPLPTPPATSAAAPSSAAATSVVGAVTSASGPNGHERTIWPLVPILGALLIVAIWIAAPRAQRRR